MLPGFKREQEERIGLSWVMEKFTPITPFGKELKKNIVPFSPKNIERLNLELEAVEELAVWARSNHLWVEDIKLILERFKEIRGTLERLRVADSVLDEIDLFELKNFAITTSELKPLIDTCKLSKIKINLPELSKIISLLNPNPPITRSFYVSDSFSPELAAVRSEKQEIERKLFSNLSAISETEREALFSSRREIVSKERALEEQVRRELSETLRGYLSQIECSIACTAQFDFLSAKAFLALELNAQKPIISTAETRIVLHEAMNPMVAAELASRGRTFVPISIELATGANVVTGANMGGKSVALATVALSTALAMCGFFVTAKKLSMPPLHYIFYLSEDLQSVKQGLSTFGAEVAEMKRLTALMHNFDGLAVIDEFARGTNPEEGEALMRAFLEYASRYNSFCLASTHYSNVVGSAMRHFQVIGLKKVDLEKLRHRLNEEKERSFELLQDMMDYRLEQVEWNSPPPRDALRVAELLGLDEELLNLARNHILERARQKV